MNTPPSKVLIIDSHKPVGELIAAILRSAGLLTLTSYNITQSLAHLEAGKFDFVFADYQTTRNRESPIASLLLAKIKAQNPAVQIVIMSDNFPDGHMCGYPFLPKPFTYRELLGKCGLLKPEGLPRVIVKNAALAL